jgi:hypothetical protein
VAPAPPGEPVDVSIVLPSPPVEPTDVVIAAPSPPAEPFDVPTVLPAPPTDPIDVSVVAPSPPVEPIDCVIELAEGPPTYPNAVQFGDGPSVNPVPEIVRTADPEGRRDSASILLLVEKSKRVVEGIQQIINEIRSTTGIEAINAAIKIGAKLAVQGITGATGLGRHAAIRAINAATPYAVPGVTEAVDRAQSELQALITDFEMGRENPYVDGNSYETHARFTLWDVNAEVSDPDDVSPSRRKSLADAFERSINVKLSTTNAKRRAPKSATDDPVHPATFFGRGSLRGQIPMSFDGEGPDSALVTDNQSRLPSTIIPDDAAYVPLSFTDMRPLAGDQSFRTVYFRPFITSLTEDLSPEWNKQTFYGRSDQVATYMSTIRTFNVGFSLHAFHPDDLVVIYRKLNWLSSMVYPEYDLERLLAAGPVVRIRVGDVVCSRNRQGLPGIIDSLSFDYTDSIWEVEQGSKVPRSVGVTVAFHVLHDAVIGRGPGGAFGEVGTDGGVETSLPFRGFGELRKR